MLTKKAAISQAKSLINELRATGYSIPRSVIFGSFVKNQQNKHSDIDLAVWDQRFTGCLAVDYEPIKHILSKYDRIELHTFPENDNTEKNPFISVIEKQCIELV